MSDIDPRFAEYRDALTDARRGLSAPVGAHERYRQSLLPYVECEAERTPEPMRKYLMRALFNAGLPLGVILAGFKATSLEAEYVKAHPPIEPEPVDEIERLQRLSYRAYLRTPHWQQVREAALERADHRCLLCNGTRHLEVHHRTYERRGCERPADVAVLCDSCHTRHHGALRAA